MEHSRLRPSSASRWVHCPGSVILEDQFQELDEEHGAEGTASHHAACELLQGRNMPYCGTQAPNGVVLDEMMLKSAQVYVDAVLSAAAGASLAVEMKLDIPQVHQQCGGTPDTWYYLPEPQELHIWDYKYGWGIVEAHENWQGICYALGALFYLAQYFRCDLDVATRNTRVIIHIVQPRPYHVLGPIREWRIDGGKLLDYALRLAVAAQEATGKDPLCRTGSYCRYCLGRHACKAAQVAAMYSCEYICGATPEVLSPEAIAVELATLKRCEEAVKLRRTGLEAQALAMLNKGLPVPGLGIENGSGRRSWDKPVNEIIAVGDLLGLNLRKPLEVVTPTEARNKKLPEDVIKALSSISSTGQKLVPTGNTLAARVFGPRGII